MSDKKQILLAFFIPLFLAVGLIALRIFVFYDPYDPWIREETVAPPYDHYEISEQLKIFGLLIVGFFVLSLILPSFVMMRTYQSRRNQFKTRSVIE
jgi:hypothetical protein